MTTEDADNLVAISEPETYDLSRYPIPRAESVPDQLRDTVDRPIFNAEELTWDVLSTRADTAADAGDSDGACMNFGWYCQTVHLPMKGSIPFQTCLIIPPV